MFKTKIHIVVLFLAFASCSRSKNEQDADAARGQRGDDTSLTLTASQLKNAEIKTGRSELRAMHGSLRVNGTVEVAPEDTYTVSFPLGGYIRSCRLIPGMKVKKGFLLARLEDQSFIQLQQDYLVARAKLEFSIADLERQRGLNKSQSNSQRVLQQAEADYASQMVLVKALAEKLRMLGINPTRLTANNLSRTVSVYSPIEGFVSKVNINSGKYVSPTDVMFELIDPGNVHIDLLVFEKDAGLLKQGMTVACAVSTDPGRKVIAKIAHVGRNLDDNRAITVHCHIEQNTGKLMPGNFINATIQLDNEQVNALPDNALVSWEGKQYVFMTDDSKTFRMVAINTGRTIEGYTEITSTLSPGLVVTENAYALLGMLKNKSDE